MEVTGAIHVYWAVPPRKWVLKGVEEVPEDPGQYHVVEETNKEGYGHGGHACV